MSAAITVVVLSGGRIPDPGGLTAAQRLRDRGARVCLISRQLPTPEQRAVFDEAHVLGRGPADALRASVDTAEVAAPPADTPPAPVRPPLPQLVVRRAQLDARRARRAGRRALVRAQRAARGRLVPPGPRPMAGDLRRDPAAATLLQQADLVVALDRAGIPAAWQQARRTGAGAVLGLAAAVWWVEHR